MENKEVKMNGHSAPKDADGKPVLSKAQKKIEDNHRALAEKIQRKLLEFTNKFVDYLINTDELSTAIIEAKISLLDKQWRLYLYNQGCASGESVTLLAHNCRVIVEKFEEKMADAPEQPVAESSAPMEVVKEDLDNGPCPGCVEGCNECTNRQ